MGKTAGIHGKASRARQGGFKIGLAALLLAGTAMISTPADAQSFRFNSVSVVGNERIEDGTVLSFAGIPRGESVSAAELNDAVQRLVATGLFESVDVIPRGSQLVIEVTEYPTINRISFEGNRKLSDADLQPLIRSQSRRAFNPATVEQDAANITDAYVTDGRLAATVMPKIIRRDNNRVDLVFEIFEGKNVEIERIGFVGNRVYSDRRLRRVLETKQAGLLRALVRRDTFVADRIEFDKQVLRDFYQSRGYVDFQVLSVNAEVARERDGVFVTFNVQEGQQFKFGNVTTISDLPNVDADLFQAVNNIRQGAVYSPTAVENVITRMERLAIREGLQFIRVEPRISRNDRAQTLDVEFVISRGPRIFVERIDIEGNTTTLDRVIRREFDLVEGDPFNPRMIREAAQRIRALGFFADTDVNAREGSAPDQVIVDVDVEEQPTGSLTFGANYSSANGFGFIASFAERNFLGRGQSLNFGLTTGERNARFNFNFVEPYFLGRDLAFGLNLSYATTDNDNALYDTDTARFSPSFSFPVSENGRLTLRYTAEMTDITGVSDDASEIIKNEADEGRRLDSSIGYSYSFDTRRTGLDPNSGVLFRFGQDFGGAGGDTRFIKTNAEVVAQTRILSEEVTLRATLEGGTLNYLDGDSSRVTDRYFLGSAVMRGFEPGGIGPRDADTDDALGGNVYAVARFEAEFPLGLPEEYGITGGVFYDVGSLWDVGETYGEDVLYNDFTARHVVGVSVFWATPIGPLRFNFTDAIRKEEQDREQTFDLTISTQF